MCKCLHIWWKRFKDGRESLIDDERCRKPSTAVHNKNVAKVRARLLEQPHLTLWTIAENLDIV